MSKKPNKKITKPTRTKVVPSLTTQVLNLLGFIRVRKTSFGTPSNNDIILFLDEDDKLRYKDSQNRIFEISSFFYSY